jgi:ribosomal-protein-alanine N-acetyltransferase
MGEAANPMIIRRATAADIPALQSVGAHAAMAPRWTDDTYNRIFRSESLPRLVLVLQEGEVVVGFMVTLCCGREWELENIAVSQSARRRGLGMRLLDEMLERAADAGVERVFLEVRESNYPARALYEKCAFVELGRRPGYYREPAEDAVIYCFDFLDGKPMPKVTDSK